MAQDDPLIYLNGSILPRSEGRLPIDDRGFLFGDGVYEVFRVVEGRIFRGEDHLERLEEGLAALRLTPPEELAEGRILPIARDLLERNGHDRGEATIYLQVTRGSAPRTHHFPPVGTAPTLLLLTGAFQVPDAIHAEGARCILHPDRRWARAHIKSVNLLPNVLAKQAARDAGAVEALFVRDGMVLEGASTNVFAVLDGVLRTYPAANYILKGVTRDVVLELARAEEFPVREEGLAVEDLFRVEELFLTGTTTDVLPVVGVDDRTIGNGRPGPVTRRLQEALAKTMRTP